MKVLGDVRGVGRSDELEAAAGAAGVVRALVTAPALPAHGHAVARGVDAANAALAEEHFAAVSGAMNSEHVDIVLPWSRACEWQDCAYPKGFRQDGGHGR